MGDEGEADPVVANVDVWMVAGSFSKFRDVVDETHGGNKVVKLEDAHQFLRLDVPFRRRIFKQENDLLIRERTGFLLSITTHGVEIDVGRMAGMPEAGKVMNPRRQLSGGWGDGRNVKGREALILAGDF